LAPKLLSIAMNMKKQSDEILLGILDGAVMVLDPQFCVQYMNQSAEVLLGLSFQRLHGQRVAGFIQDRAFLQQLQFAATQHEVHAIREQLLELADGRQTTIDCMVTPLLEVDGFEPGCLLLELQSLDRQLRIVRDEHILSQQQAVHELVRGLAHEIKNPLGGLRGAAQLLEAELDDPALIEYVQIIISEADRLKQLVNSLLGPRQLPRSEWVNVHEVLEHVAQLARIEGAAAICFRRDYDPSIPEFLFDRGHLVQVCLNILNNAVRAVGTQGTITLKTRILRQFTIRQTCYRLVLRTDICDDGPGVPVHLLDKIFLPMVSGHAQGSGLGLSIAQSLLRQYDGMIQYQSRPGQTCFSILIPLNLEDTLHEK